MEIFIFNENTNPASFSSLFYSLKFQNTSVTGYSRAFGYAICSVLDHMASSIEKAHKAQPPEWKTWPKRQNPSHLICIHITACFPDHSLVLTLDIF
jgi:hypothetical protein